MHENHAQRGRIAGVPQRVHLLGAGGSGVSGAARILWEHGHTVSGHDRVESESVRMLRALGIDVLVDRATSLPLPGDVELVVRSAAVPADDAAVAAAAARGVPVMKYSQLLGRLTPRGRTLAVAGTHGKTTTAWMLYHAMRGLAGSSAHPGALIGGICRRSQSSAIAAEPGGWFAVEACEYDRSFLALEPMGAIVTNVEADHLDYYGDLGAIEEAFARFVHAVHPDGLLVLGRDVPGKIEAAARCRVWRAGRDLAVELVAERQGRFAFRLRAPGFQTRVVTLAVPGGFNVDNAALALALSIGLCGGAAPSLAARAASATLEEYTGARRRFEPWGTVGGIQVVHDYAHHPTEVRVTLEGARRALPGLPLHVLFQPHQASRTARFLREFAESLRFADRVVVSDVYGARKHIDGGHLAGAEDLAQELRARGVVACAAGDLSASLAAFVQALPDPCAALVVGAGDVEGIQHELLQSLALRRAVPGTASR